MKVAVANAFPDDNKGGAAVTAATVDAIRDAFGDCEVGLIAVRDGDLAHRFRHTRARHRSVRVLPPPLPVGARLFAGAQTVLKSLIHLWRRPNLEMPPAFQYLLTADLVVSKGGHYFVEQSTLRGLFGLWMTAYPMAFAARHGTPTVISGATVGPLQGRGSKLVNGFVLRRMDLVMVRDPASRTECLALGLDGSKVVTLCDSAFYLRPPGDDARRRTLERLGLDGVRFAAVTVRDMPRGQRDRLYEQLWSVLQAMVGDGLIDRVVVIVQVGRPEDAGRTARRDGRIQEGSDLACSRDFVARFAEHEAMLMSEDLSPEELVGVYAGASFTIACRLHSAILSLLGSTPSFPVAVVPKVVNVFDGLGLGHHVVTFPNFSTVEVRQRIEAIAGAEETRDEMARIVRSQRERLARLPELLRATAGQGRGDRLRRRGRGRTSADGVG